MRTVIALLLASAPVAPAAAQGTGAPAAESPVRTIPVVVQNAPAQEEASDAPVRAEQPERQEAHSDTTGPRAPATRRHSNTRMSRARNEAPPRADRRVLPNHVRARDINEDDDPMRDPVIGLGTIQTNDLDPATARRLDDPGAMAVARALNERLTVWHNGRRRVYVRHCREGGVDCMTRIAAMARIIVDSARIHRVDPFLVAAMALRESGLNPFAEGGIGERGLIQLHPRGVGNDVRFVQNDTYRTRCAQRADACQAEVLDVGARLLANSIQRCGSVEDGLGAYNSGHCQTTSYSARVLEERQNLLHLLKRGRRPYAREEGTNDPT